MRGGLNHDYSVSFKVKERLEDSIRVIITLHICDDYSGKENKQKFLMTKYTDTTDFRIYTMSGSSEEYRISIVNMVRMMYRDNPTFLDDTDYFELF